MKKKHFLLSLLIVLTSLGWAGEGYPFNNPGLPLEVRIKDLLSRLNLEEKVSLLLHDSPALQRLGIPAYNWWNEALHGVGRAGKATVFPQAIGLAASFDRHLVYRVASAISDEARGKYNRAIIKGNRQGYVGLSFWTPNINIYRDPRWGRGQETYGEDPYLTSMMGVAFVKGLQGDHPKYLKTAACAKHYAVHSGPEALRHSINIKPDEADLWDTYLPAFRALVEAGVESVMCAYHRLNDEPCCGSIYWLKKVLKEGWKFSGHIVSDCWALDDIWRRHMVVKDEVEAAAQAAKAGVNLNCGYIYRYLPSAVKRGLIPEVTIDHILTPLLRTRMKLGLLEKPVLNPFAGISPRIVNCKKHRELAYEAAAKSIVLLKNDRILPLNLAKVKKIFLTGPSMLDNMVLLGNYNGFSGNLVTLLEGIINRVDAGTIVDYRQGCLFNTPDIFNGEYLAAKADITIVALGLSRLLEGEEGDALLSDGGGDRKRIGLPSNQVELVRRLKNQGKNKPLIAVLTGGGAIAIPEILNLADAVLYIWYPGEQGGNALADVIFGNINPAGRLPVTFYRNQGDLPAFADYSMKNRTYRYFGGKPLFPFGYGLSYTRFSYSKLLTDKDLYTEKDQIRLSVTVQNAGEFAGDEVIQVYLKWLSRDRHTPLKSLKGFKRLHFEINEKKRITFILPVLDLAAWDLKDKNYRVRSGKYEIQIGSSSRDIRVKKTIRVR